MEIFSYCVKLLALFLFSGSVQAVTIIDRNASLPSNTSSSCWDALSADLNCAATITRLRPGLYVPETVLAAICTADCKDSLSSYEQGIVSACAGQTYDSLSSSGDLPISIIPQQLRYNFNLTCLNDASSGQYCNVLAAQSLGITANQSNLYDPDLEGGNTTCSDCDLKTYQFKAGSPFYADDDVVSIYSSLTSSCKATNYPLSTSTFTFPVTATATSTAGATPTCTGTHYTLTSGDTCQSIAKEQNVGTNWLMTDNNLPAYCHNFPSNGTLCIQHNCPTYTVKTNDTCSSIASAYNATYAQILAWNPSIDLSCSNINRSVGFEICVDSPGPKYTAPSSTVAEATTATTPAPVPTNAVNGSNTDCGEWYEIQSGDECNVLVLRYGISIDDFIFLNPELNENCTNLYANESYCVEPVGDINDYPGAPGYESSTPSISYIPYSSLPKATYIPALYDPGNGTYANGTRKDCAIYLDGSDWQLDLTNNSYTNVCELAVDVYGVSMQDFLNWNPILNSTNSTSGCSFDNNILYCAKWSTVTATTTVSQQPIATANGTVAGCSQHDFAGDGVSCDALVSYWNITMASFAGWNPGVGSDCGNFQTNVWYCVQSNSTVSITATSATATSTSTVTPPAPTQTGIPADCNKYYVPQDGDDCSSVATKFNITTSQFHDWNPAVASDCKTGFWLEEAYCVGVSGSSSTSATATTSTVSSSSTTPASTTDTSVVPPAPTQTGIPADCDKYYVPQDGDDCGTVATKFGITTAQFHDWNPAVSSDCKTGFWLEEAYCVGVSGSSSGSATSTSSKTTASTTNTSVVPPGPTQTGIPANCNKYYVAKDNDECGTVETLYGITDAQFHEWNPAVSSDCKTGFWVKEAYCVGVSS